MGTAPEIADPARLLLALVVIIAVTQVCARVLARFGQPLVVGEIVGGIVLGPSILGALAPQVQRWLLPAAVRAPIHCLGDLGVIVFVFLVGYELQWSLLRSEGPRAALVGCCMVVVPFVCGLGLAQSLLAVARPDTANRLSFTIFVGVAITVTALPVLARVLAEFDLHAHRLGASALAAAAVIDVGAWTLLSVATATAGASSRWHVLGVLGGVAALAVLLWLSLHGVRRRWFVSASMESVAPLVVVTILVAATVTVALGIHSILGAFLAGLIMPRAPGVAAVADRIASCGRWLLLPLFFAAVGTEMHLGAITTGTTLVWLVLVVVVTVAAKFTTAAMTTGLLGGSRRDSLAVGFMLNCRGLTDLVILQLGLDRGIISSELFAVFVVATLITTAVLGPALRRILHGHAATS